MSSDSFPFEESVGLAAGEEANVESDGAVRLTLVNGVADLAGSPMRPQEPLTFKLYGGGARRLCICSSDGGSITIRSSQPCKIWKQPSQIFAVYAFERELREYSKVRVLVLGGAHTGKSFASRIVANCFLRNVSPDHTASLMFVDLDVSGNVLFCPGCVACAEFSGVAGIPHDDPCQETPAVAFFTGTTTVNSSNMALVLHQVQQLMACVKALTHQSQSSKLNHDLITVIDAPDASHEFYKRLAEVVTPTHVLALGEEQKWSELKSDLERINRQLKFTVLRPLQTRSQTARNDRNRVGEYFAGTVMNPLGCARITFQVRALTFVQVYFSDGLVRHRIVEPRENLCNSLCAVSHAAILEEVPFANIVGVVLLTEVNMDEVTLVIPTGSEALPRKFLIVGETVGTKFDLHSIASHAL